MKHYDEDYPRGARHHSRVCKVPPADGLRELNERFLRAGVGYQFENEQIIRMDSQYVHAEVVKDALRLLVSRVSRRRTTSS